MSDDDVIVRLRAARDAMMSDAPPAPSLARPTTGAARPARTGWRSPRVLAVAATVAIMALAAVGLAAFTHHGTTRNGAAAGVTSSLDDPYNYKSITRSYPTGAHMRTETWFPVSGVGPYMTRVTMTGPDKWSDVTTPAGKGVYVFRSTCGAPRPPIPIVGAPYSRLFCPPGEQTRMSTRPGSGSAKINTWDWPTPKFLATLPTDRVALERSYRQNMAIVMKGQGTAARITDQELVDFPDLLTQGGYMSAALSAAIRDLIAHHPGARVVSNVKNLDGQVGTEYVFINRLSSPDGRDLTAAEPRLIFNARGMYIGTGYSPDLVTGKDRYPEYGVTTYAGGTASSAGGTPHLNG